MADITGDAGSDESSEGKPNEGNIDEIAYKLEDWDDESFVNAEEALREAGIGFRREGFDTLIVGPGDEEAVDALLDRVEEQRAAELGAGGNGSQPSGDGED